MKGFYILLIFLFSILCIFPQNISKTPLTGNEKEMFKESEPTINPNVYLTGNVRWSEGFEDVTFPPTGWQAISVLGAKTWVRSTSTPHSGTACAFMDYETSGGEDWLITPKFLVTATDSVTFFLRKKFTSSFPPDFLEVRISTTDSALASFTTLLRSIDVNSLTSTTIFDYFADALSAYAGQKIFIAFKHFDTDGNGVYLDDFVITAPVLPNDVGMASLNLPGNVIPGNVNPTAVVKNYGSATQTFNVTLKIGSYTSTKSVTALAGGSTSDVTFDTWAAAVGNYSAKVYTQLAGDGNAANDTIVKAVAVAVSTIIFEDLFNVDNSQTAVEARGWKVINNDGGGTTTTFTGNTTVFSAFEGPASGYLAENYQGANVSLIDQWLITPVVNVNAGDTLSFWYRSTDLGTSGPWPDSIYVRLSNGGNTIPDFTTEVAHNRVPNAVWTKFTYVFTTSGTKRVAIQYYIVDGGTNGTASDYWGLDIFRISVGIPVPVELASFTAVSQNNSVILNWQTVTEKNNAGFDIERRSTDGNYKSVAYISGNGTSTEVHNYSYIDNVNSGKYYYRLKQKDYDGKYEFSKEIEVDVNNLNAYSLGSNYPNPFNPNTKFNFTLPVDAKITLRVFDALGQEVAVLLNGNLTAGAHVVDFNASSLSSGLYLYKIEATGIDGSSFISVKKMILNK